MTLEVAIGFARAVLAVVLLWAGVAKLLSGHARVLESVRSYELLPGRIEPVAARVLPWVEVVTGAALLVSFAMPAPALVSVLMLAIFTAAMVRDLVSNKGGADCGCFGGSTRAKVSWLGVARNVVLLAVAALAAFPTGQGSFAWVPLPMLLTAIGVVAGAFLIGTLAPLMKMNLREE